MTTFVLIPGMCHGGWCFHELTEQLRSHGHRAYPLTLTGLSERSHLLHGGVNLDTHIQDVTGVLAAEQLQDAVLVGHSYGGMVITGVADRMPERVRSLVYLDAVVPADGESIWTTHALDSGHNLMRDVPQDLLKILLETGEPT
ncbi:alpha/beta hydrolase [Streptosporangium sp. NPDC051023]|uniref:alpha/beta fold hydrolase n=1 Tax=Streptosporangium sp. NPDC051023 TaxID=3155410 RepID=UPI00344B378C